MGRRRRTHSVPSAWVKRAVASLQAVWLRQAASVESLDAAGAPSEQDTASSRA